MAGHDTAETIVNCSLLFNQDSDNIMHLEQIADGSPIDAIELYEKYHAELIESARPQRSTYRLDVKSEEHYSPAASLLGSCSKIVMRCTVRLTHG